MSEKNLMSLDSEIYRDALYEIAKANGLDDSDTYAIECSAGSNKGDNHFGTVFRIQMKCKSDDSVRLSVIAKLPPLSEAKRGEFQAEFAFKREILAYDVILPLYEQFQRERGVEERFHEVALCHKTLSDAPHEAIFFDDLKAGNFAMFDRFRDVTKEHVLLVMRAVAKMHAVFFCLKDQKPEQVEEFRRIEDFILHHLRNEKPLFNWFYESQKKHIFEVLDTCENLEMRRRIGNYLNTSLLELFESTVGRGVEEPYVTICHGDCWNNNMMFREDEKETPIDIRLIDFQILRYAPPVTDLIYYLFTSVTQEMRKLHFEEFLSVYYDTLASHVERLGSNPTVVYPRDAFNDQMKKFGRYGLFMAAITLPAVTLDSEEFLDLNLVCEDLKDSADSKKDTKVSNRYKERMKGVFEDMFELGYI